MPIFDVYSIADADFLSQVLISLAMICKTLSFMTAVKIGMVLGVFVAVFQSISKNGQEFPIGSIFLGYIIFSLMFVPKATVQVIDTYTASVKVVDEVPIGPAAAGGIISSMGRKLTDLFELGYGPIAPYLNSQIGFADTLKILNDTRRVAVQPALVQAMNAELCGVAYGSTVGCTIDVNASLENYIRDCTLKKIDLGLMNSSELQTIPYKDALKFSSLLHNTLLFDKPSLPEGTLTTCDAAWTTLDKMIFDSTNGEKTATQLANMLGISHIAAASSSVEYKSRLQGAIDGLMPVAMSSQEYIATSVIQPALNRAANDKSINQLDGSTAIMVNAAIQQRNTQWAGEQSLFMSVVRPMMAFFEAFIYSVSPIMAFLFVLGAPGIKFAGKYFLLLLWVQLWMPLLSIVNLYIYVAGHREMQTISSQPGGNFVSFYTMNTSADVLQNWLAVGGMLAASTPVLALMLIYGGAVTATSMASRMAGSDHINEKTVAPDPVSTAPVLAAGSMHTGNPYTTSSAMTGAPAMASSVSQQASMAKAAVESTYKAASTSYSNALSNVVSGTATVTEQSQASAAATATTSTTSNDTISAARSFVSNNSSGAGFSSTSAEKINSAINLGVAQEASRAKSASAQNGAKSEDSKFKSSNVIGALGKIAGVMGLSADETRVAQAALEHRSSNGLSLADDTSAQSMLSDGLLANLTRQNSNSNLASGSQGGSSTLTSAAQNLTATQTAATKTISTVDQVMSSSNVSIPDIAARGAVDPAIQRMISSAEQLMPVSDRQAAMHNAARIQENEFRSPEAARNQAVLQQLINPTGANGDPSTLASRWSQFSGIVSAYHNNTSPALSADNLNSSRFDGIKPVSSTEEQPLSAPSSYTNSPTSPTSASMPVESPTVDQVRSAAPQVENASDFNSMRVAIASQRMADQANSSNLGSNFQNQARQHMHQAADNLPDLRTQLGGSVIDNLSQLKSMATYKDGEDGKAAASNNKSIAMQSLNENVAAHSPAQNAERADRIHSQLAENPVYQRIVGENLEQPYQGSPDYNSSVSGLTPLQQSSIVAYNRMMSSQVGNEAGSSVSSNRSEQETEALLSTPGLTSSQRMILAGSLTGNETLRNEGLDQLYRSMANRDENDEPIQVNGAYQLSPQNQADAAAMTRILDSAGDAGDRHVGSGISAVVNFNNSSVRSNYQ